MIQRFLLFCAGADNSLMRGEEFSTERIRFAASGVFVFLTAIFATAFSSFCIHTINDNRVIYISCGLLWGFFIFCFDRLIVITMKSGDALYRKMLLAVPRIIMAGFIGVMISKPFELFIFAPEVNAIVSRNEEQRLLNEKKEREIKIQQTNDVVKSQINGNHKQIQPLREQIVQWQSQIQSANNDMQKIQMDKTLSESQKHWAFQTAQLERDRVKQENTPLIQSIARQIQDLERQNKAFGSKIVDSNEPSTKLPQIDPRKAGLLMKIKALEDFGSENQTAGTALKFLMCFFIFIEVAPALAKIFISSSLYDTVVQCREATAQKIVEDEKKAADATSIARQQSLADMEIKIIQRSSAEFESVLASDDLNDLLNRSRLSLARKIAASLAYSLERGARGLRSGESSRGSFYEREIDKELRRSVNSMVKERGSSEVKKGILKGFSEYTIQRARNIYADIKHRFAKRKESDYPEDNDE